MASNPETVGKPQDWDKAVSAAYLWMLADSVKAAAEGAGVSERNMHRWIRSDWWSDACAEAEGRWLRHLTAESRRTVMKAVQEGNAELALRILERRDPEMAPAAKRFDVRLGIQGYIANLPAEEVRRLLALPDDERRIEVQRLIGDGGAAGE